MKKTLLFLLAALALSAAPAAGFLPAPSCSCNRYQGVEGKLFSATPCTNEPCHPCGMFVVFDVSLLAWQAIEEGLDFALKNNPLPIQANVNINGRLIGPDFSWEPALKINAGMIFSERAWDIHFQWTYFQGDSSRTVSAPVSGNSAGLIPVWAFPNADKAAQFLYGSAKGSLNLNFDGFDIEMGYNPFLTPLLSFRFHAGLKVATINQEYHVRYGNGFNDGTVALLTSNTDLSNKAIGAGPRLGFDSKWHLGSGFSLLGSIAGSLPLWHYRVGRTDIVENLRNNALEVLNAAFRDRFWIFRPILETALGFGWDTCYGCRCQYPFGILANYELQYYSEQNMMSMLVNPGLLSQSFMPRGDLIFHGATFTLHFGF